MSASAPRPDHTYAPAASTNTVAPPRSAGDGGGSFVPDTRDVRHDGWTCERQIVFIEELAARGCVAFAATSAGMSPSSAYRFRMKRGSAAFAAAWEQALVMATVHLTDLAYHRAVNGVIEETRRDGDVLIQKRRYSDKLLMFLLTHMRPHKFGHLQGLTQAVIPDFTKNASQVMPDLMRRFTDEYTGADIDDEAGDDRAGYDMFEDTEWADSYGRNMFAVNSDDDDMDDAERYGGFPNNAHTGGG